jgi:oligogalacturonide transporter
MNWVYKKRKINITRGLGYGLIDLMGGGWNNIVSGVIFTFLMMNGIEPSIAGEITGIGRIIDAIVCLFIGGITDNFYKTRLGKRFGRRHFFIFTGGVLFTCIFPLFWLHASSLFYLTVYIAIEIIIAFILIPWETLPTEMTSDYGLRTVLSGSRMFISATGTSLVFIILAVLKSMNNPNAYFITGITWTVIFSIAIFVSYRTTWEKHFNEIDTKRASESFNIKKNINDYLSTFKNKSFRKHISVYLLSFTGKDFFATMFPTFVIFACGLTESDSWTMLALAFVGIPVTVLASYLMIKKGPKYLFTLSFSTIMLALFAFTLVYFLNIKSHLFVIMVVISCFYQAGRSILEFTPWSVFPFIPDVDRLITRENRAGVYASVMTFFRKSTGAVASWVAGILLSLIHFDKNIPITYGIRTGITLIFVLVPFILILMALLIARTFNLNKQTHKVLIDELNRLDNGGSKQDVKAETKNVVEMLTGVEYNELYK